MDKQAILHEHNKARQMLAQGKVGGQPAAMNMREMIWDEELARIAQRWADQCMPGHDHARNVGRGYEVQSWYILTPAQTGLRLDRMLRPPGHTKGIHLIRMLLSSRDMSLVGLKRQVST